MPCRQFPVQDSCEEQQVSSSLGGMWQGSAGMRMGFPQQGGLHRDAQPIASWLCHRMPNLKACDNLLHGAVFYGVVIKRQGSSLAVDEQRKFAERCMSLWPNKSPATAQ